MGIVKTGAQIGIDGEYCDRSGRFYLEDDTGYFEIRSVDGKYLGRYVEIVGELRFIPCLALCICDSYIQVEYIKTHE